MNTLKIPKQLFREGTATMQDGAIRLSISSDAPYLRYNWSDDSEYLEVLDHTPGSVDLSRITNGAALLFNHKRDIQLGTISSPTLEGGRCYVQTKLSNAPDVASYKTRVEEGILKDTSIGYEVTDSGTKIGEQNGVPIYKFKFAIHEASLVTIPADPSVGLGRSRSEEPKCGLKEIGIDLPQPNCNKPSMTKENEVTETPAETPVAPVETQVETPVVETVIVETPTETPVEEVPQVDTAAIATEATGVERARVVSLQKWASEISALRRIDLRDSLASHVADGKSLAEFKEWVLANEFKAKSLSFNSEIVAPAAMSREHFNTRPAHEQSAHCRSGGRITD